MKGALLVFAAFAGLYLWTLPPALPPYRDAGEMTSSAATLGVSHPTGYPLYILLGRASQSLPLGNKAYRMGLLSAAAGAACAALLFAAVAARLGVLPGLGAALLVGLNPTFWGVSLVPEMYSLAALCAAALLALAWNLREAATQRRWLGFCFLYGLFLTNRMDIVLWAPGLLWIALGPGVERPREEGAWAFLALVLLPVVMAGTESKAPLALLIVATAFWRLAPGSRWRWAAAGLGFAALGLSLDLYLPVRSAARPWLDWNHPARLSNFLESILRSRYGGTLDLLSRNYARGELWRPNLIVYGRHLWEGFSAVGLAAAAVGLARLARLDRRLLLGSAAAYVWSGPLFLFMANMPPNPHALAIVEPHYLLSDLILAFWAGHGLAALAAARSWPAAAAVAALAVVPFADGLAGRMDRREHVFTCDYARNLLMSVPRGGVVVAKKDVQLYTLWHYQTVHGWRPDVRVVAQGLAGSAWYQEGWKLHGERPGAPPLSLGPLRDPAGWSRFLEGNPAVFATPDSEVPPEVGPRRQSGLVSALGSAAAALGPGKPDPAALFVLRGDYRYEAQPDFFTSDLIDDYARALLFSASEFSKAGAFGEASALLGRAWGMHWLFPEAATLLGYSAFSAGDLAAAGRYYGLSVALYGVMRSLAEEYHSLPGLKAGLAAGAAESFLHLGVAREKEGDREAAERAYASSLSLQPTAQARFNMAVLYWNRDMARAEHELAEAVRLDPGHPEAAKYLAILRSRKPGNR